MFTTATMLALALSVMSDAPPPLLEAVAVPSS